MALEKVFIRFGDLPESGCSFNHATRGYEGGVSVHRALKDEDGFYGLQVAGLWARLTVTMLFAIEQRPTFAVSGRVVGAGYDQEPLLVDVALVEEIPRSRIEALPFDWRLWKEFLRAPAPVGNPARYLRWQRRMRPQNLTEDEKRSLWLELWE